MSSDNTNNNTNSTEEVNEDEAPLIANKNKSILNQILYNIYQSSSDQTTFKDFEIEDYPNPDRKFRKEIKRFVNNVFSIGGVNTPGWGSDNQSPQVYITFGALLAIIQTKIILHDNSKGSDTSIPLFRFDMNFNNLKNDKNYILKIPGQFSSDPRICIIPYENTIPPLPDLELKEFDINTELKKLSYWNVNNEPYVGRLAALFVNIDYLTKVLDDLPLDEENNVNILDFLKEVIKGITQALGGINKINITITEDGLIRFIEEIPQRLKEIEITEEKQYARFNVFGVKPGIEGSFITSINLDAEIPSSFAATVAIGSQSNGNQKSGNATAFSNYNRGLKDRIIPEKITGTEASNSDEDVEQEDQLVKNFEKILKVDAYGLGRSPFGKIYNAKKWFPDKIDTLTNLNTTHASLMLGRLTQPDKNGNQQLQSSFFLPFNFSIEMEGLSGMVLYEKFKISEEILPPSYEKGGVDIQIKGIDHTVNDKGWKTKLETQSVPAAKLSPISTSYPLNVFRGGSIPVFGGGSSSSTNTGQALPLSLSSPPESLDPTSASRFNAMQKSYNEVFARDGAVSGMCSRWTYNLAKNYISFLRGGELQNPQLASGGNANNNQQYYINLVNLGYTKTKSIVTKEQLINQITTTTWGYGDVIAYWCNNGPTGQSHVKYGHTQIYVGEINSSKWVTSTQTNYNTDFPYRSRTGDNWTYLVFRAPSS